MLSYWKFKNITLSNNANYNIIIITVTLLLLNYNTIVIAIIYKFGQYYAKYAYHAEKLSPWGGGQLKEFMGGDVPLGPWDPGTLNLC